MTTAQSTLTLREHSVLYICLLRRSVCVACFSLLACAASVSSCAVDSTTTMMVNPKMATLQNHFRHHDLRFKTFPRYLDSRFEGEKNATQLRDILTELKNVSSKAEELTEQLSAQLLPDELEPFLQNSVETSLLVL